MMYDIFFKEYQLGIKILNLAENVHFAAYLYRNYKCIERKMYTKKNSIYFDYDFNKKSGLFYIKIFIKKEGNISKSDTCYFYLKTDRELVLVDRKKILNIDNVLIEGYIQNSDILFITFNGTRTTQKSRPFGLDFILQKGWSCICVYQDNDTQYQYLSEELLYRETFLFTRNKKVFTYGVSLGGYCAIYYGGILNATIIAGSPRNSAHPSICIERFKDLEFNQKDIKDTTKTKKIYA